MYVCGLLPMRYHIAPELTRFLTAPWQPGKTTLAHNEVNLYHFLTLSVAVALLQSVSFARVLFCLLSRIKPALAWRAQSS